jgi:3-hydroxyacyl-[acyl-carrier-protein] dehydratase
MKFHLVDRITELQPGRLIRTVKALSLSEEYLADHFPAFPVMPGVLMVESLVQAAAWLVRASRDFGPTVVTLREVRNAVYGQFVRPGSRLEVEVTADDWFDGGVKVRGVGKVDGGETAVRGKLTLRFGGLPDPAADARLRDHHRARFALIGGPEALRSAATAAAAATAPAAPAAGA